GGSPLFFVREIAGVAEIGGSVTRVDLSGKVGVKAEDGVGVEAIGGDEEFLARVATSFFQPGDVFVAGEERILAVGALAGPIGHPIGSVVEELRGAESVGQKD